MDDNLGDLYRDIIMDHYKYPRGNKKIEKSDVHREGKNPVCGDEIEVSIKVKDNMVEDISVECVGCAISVASGSMLADTIKGKPLDEVKKIAKIVKSLLKGETIDESVDLGDLEALEGVNKFPVRIKCALLSWTTLIDGIESLSEAETLTTSSTE